MRVGYFTLPTTPHAGASASYLAVVKIADVFSAGLGSGRLSLPALTRRTTAGASNATAFFRVSACSGRSR